MNNLRSYLMRSAPGMATCQEPDAALDEQIAGCRTDRQRRILEWHISGCPSCSKYLKAYRESTGQEKSVAGNRPEPRPQEQSGRAVQSIQAGKGNQADAEFAIFAASPLFRGLPQPDLKRLYARGRILDLEADAVVIEEGKVNSGLYVVLSGEFKVSLPSGPDRYGEVELARRQAPDCFGEYAFIDYKLASANVSATQRSRLFKIDFDILDTFIDSDAQLGRAIYENVLLLVVTRLRAENTELDLFKPWSAELQ